MGAFRLNAFDQSLRQSELCPQSAFAARHLSRVNFVIVSREMQQAVEHEHLQLGSQGLAAGGALTARGGHADRKVARDSFRAGDHCLRWERKDVGCLVDAAELPVEPADGSVSREQNADSPS